MAESRIRSVSRWKAFVVGLILTTALTVAGVTVPEFRLFESKGQDILLWRLRAQQDVSPEITIVGVDDNALEMIGRWPWSWRDLAGIIDSMSSLGARLIVLDITFPTRPEYEIPRGAAPSQQVQPIDPVPYLEEAIRRSGRVILTYSIHTSEAVTDPLYHRIEESLASEPGLSYAQLAARLGADESQVGRFFHLALRRALERYLTAALPLTASREDAEAALDRAFAALPETERAERAFSRQLAVDAFLRQQAVLAAGTVTLESEEAAWSVPEAARIDGPLVDLTLAAHATGFANVQPDRDGVMRRIPLAIRFGDCVLPQLALQAAMHAQDIHDYTIRRTAADRMEICRKDGSVLGVPVGADGLMVVNWTESSLTRGKAAGTQDQFRRLQIGKLYELYDLRRLENEYHAMMQSAAERLGKGRERQEACRRVMEALDQGVDAEKVTELDDQLTDIDADVEMQLRMSLSDGKPQDMTGEEFERLKKVSPQFLTYQEIRDRERKRRRDIEAGLSEFIRDRVCFVGMTATSLAPDLKPTPIHKQYPGVAAHASITDDFLRRQFVREAGVPTVVVTMIVTGLIVTLLSASLPTLRAVILSVAILAAYYVLGIHLFRHQGLLMPILGVWLAGLTALLGVMTYRELTEGRNRRWITGVFKQYTSGKLVDALVTNPEMLSLGGQRREMTVYFSDIAGFTSISEKLDAPTLVAFLQEYLEEATDRLLDQDATLDKYEGDAILSFFGAPVAMIDHAARCLRAALAHLRALPEIDRRLREKGLMPEGANLKIRIGIATGPMVVGNIGSSRRFDYTVIGDTVNVGARLEGANRFFGTTVLMTGETQQQVGDEFLLRHIGRVRVVGRAEPIDVWELLDDQRLNAREGLDLYEAAMKDFEDGWIAEARLKFEDVLKVRPGDGPTMAYLDRIDTMTRDDISAKPGPWDLLSKG
ncbi:MAG: CHASE2 domain-containing protein [Planctomycetes bacterium]|nr:CHASE2 domain-containing protein [Planctomycetota bacterium]